MNPPKRAVQFLRWFCHEDCLEEIEGDLTEVYNKQYDTSPRKAKWKFSLSVIRYFRPEFIKSFNDAPQPNSYDMFKSYFKIGWRNLLSNKSYSHINISGLALGMAVAILIGVWVFDELSYNKSFRNYNRLYNVYHSLTYDGDIYTGSGVPPQLSQELKNNFAEFEDVALTSFQADHGIGYEKASFSKPGLFVEPQFVEMFSLKLLHGTSNALKEYALHFAVENIGKCSTG